MKKLFVAAAALAAAALFQPAAAITFPSLTTIYIGSGVRDDSGINTIATAISCTNVSGVTASIRVLFLFSGGSVAGSGTVSIVHGRTHTFVTNSIASLTSNTNLITAAISQGAVNIESTQSGVFCTALIMHRTNIAEGVPLRLVRINGHPGAEE